MSADSVNTNRLLDAVDQLTKPRTIHTTIFDEDGKFKEIHSEKHPSLLELLLAGTGLTRKAATSELRIPIDADALEIWAQIRDLIRLWCRQLDATYFKDDLQRSIRNWYLAHLNAFTGSKISETTDRDVTRMVEGWVRMIENKFDPPEKREWKEACPAHVRVTDIDGNEIGWRRCGARRIVVNGEERFAIQLNVTTLTAECGRCHCQWVGQRGIMQLRYETNLRALELAEEEADRMAELERLANGADTPDIEVAI